MSLLRALKTLSEMNGTLDEESDLRRSNEIFLAEINKEFDDSQCKLNLAMTTLKLFS